MSHLVLVERTFATQRQADRWFDSLQSTAWPYVWCEHDARIRRWRVRALVEKGQLPAVATEPDASDRAVGPRH